MSSELTRRINEDVGASLARIEATLRLLDQDATVPFIARYRKEATGNLDEVKIRAIAERYAYYQGLIERRKSILAAIEKRGGLSDELRERITHCWVKSELEDLYLPFRQKRQSKAARARERGLEPLADFIAAQTPDPPLEAMARRFISLTRGVLTRTAALAGARDILVERIAENPDHRKWLRDRMLRDGVVQARAQQGPGAPKTKYSMYYDFQEPVAKIPSHRILAIRRGAREKVLTYTVEIDDAAAIAELKARVNLRPDQPGAELLERAVEDAYKRLLEPAIQKEVRSQLRARAEGEAIQVFEENLRSLLLAPPAGPIAVLGVDPGLKTGSKIAVVDETGKFLEHHVIYVAEPRVELEAARQTLAGLLERWSIRGIAIGNGTGSRETENFIRAVLAERGTDVFTVVVSEAGASVYSASKRARQEFPHVDVTVRGAISIARRLQDPLAELVKIDPKSIGVGQYQHDVDQKKLQVSLEAAVESAVNQVGVDLNTASADLLKYIAGISERLAEAILAYRDRHGAFSDRRQLLEIDGIGEKTFQQAAGFLRIKEGGNPLDRTSVHPESYPLVERMAASLGAAVADLVENPERVRAIDFAAFESEAGRFTVADIRAELLRPGRDPRKTFSAPKFRDDVRQVADLQEGMEIEGVVTNVTNFGAFVDLGVHQDGLVHISELSHQYVSDARRAVQVGDLIKVKVIGVDAQMKRISLSAKALLPKPAPRPKPQPRGRPQPPPSAAGNAHAPRPEARPRPRRPQARETVVAVNRAPQKMAEKKAAEPQLSMEEKIRLLQEKFRSPDR